MPDAGPAAPRPAVTAPRACRCEATIPSGLLEGYACGRPDCWRTAEVANTFARFVADLVRKRDAPTVAPEPPDAT